jgi:hypothetical protein
MKNTQKLICIVAFSVLATTFVSAQKKCMFIGATPGEENAEYDKHIIPQLKEWGYEIDKKHNCSELENFTEADYEPYDFIFLSETVNSGKMSTLKNVPIPMLCSDGWGAKASALAFAPEDAVGIHEPALPVVFLDGAKDQPLAAGYKPGAVVEIGTVTDRKDPCLIVWGKPTISIIPIAGVKSDPSQLIVYGIEKNTKNINGETINNRVAVIGLHAWGYDVLTEAGVKLFKAGIDWILEEK